jgi:hypothetical protein
LRTQTTTKAGKDVGEKNLHMLLMGRKISATTMKAVWRFLKTLKVELIKKKVEIIIINL